MHAVTNYAIFWLPPGYHFDTPTLDRGYVNASDANYEALVARYFDDLAETAYWSIVQQYADRTGAPGLATTFGGSWVDTEPYPNYEGTKANPLQDSDIEGEVIRAMAANGWSSGNGDSAFFVFTGQNVYGCAGSGCSYDAYCAYHSAFQESGGQVVVYADIPDPGNVDTGSCLETVVTGEPAPNSGAFADSAVNLIAHEGFESTTDPVFDGWYYQDDNHEVADECVWKFGAVAGDGSNIVLDGHKYVVQEMWSNAVGGCYIPQFPSTLVVAPSYRVVGGGSGFAPPTFSYYSAGVLRNVILSTAPTSISADVGSSWSVATTLGGSTSSERWEAGGTVGVVGSGTSLTFDYYHQYFLGFGFQVAGAGSGYSAPEVSITQLGNRADVLAGAGAWVDVGSTYNYSSVLPGSGAEERWATPIPLGTAVVLGEATEQYYNQYLVSAGYTGGGDGFAAPIFSFTSLGGQVSAPLGPEQQGLWIDAGSAYSSTNPLAGSNSTARWFSPTSAGTINVVQPGQLQIPYFLQYLVSVEGGASQSAWFNSSATAAVTTPGVYARSSGTGQRVTGFEVDGGALQPVAATTGNVTVSLKMSGPRVVTFSAVQQFQLSLDSGASAALLSVTPPTVSGDSYWYDSGAVVNLVLNGVWGRGSSTGERLVSYSLDGQPATAVATSNPLVVLQSLEMESPQSVAISTISQYRLSIIGGSVESATSPAVPGDEGWYDSGSRVVVTYDYAWDGAAGTRMSVLGVSLDGAALQVQRSGTGTFQESVVMNAAHTLQVSAVTQYELSTRGGYSVATQPPSPTRDAFYDSGSSVSVSSARFWNVASSSRDALLSYSVDGGANQTVYSAYSTDNFSSPPITFDQAEVVDFGSAEQYLVGLRFTEAGGAGAIPPQSLTISTSQPNATLEVQGPDVWIASGSTFQVTKLVWEGVDVRPLGQPLSVESPQNFTLAARVYDASLKVSDYLRIPISGAAVIFRFANGTSVVRTTGGSGAITLGPIPLGSFNVTVSSLGVSQRASEDVAVNGAQARIIVPVSFPDVVVLAICVVAMASVGYMVRRKREVGPISEPRHQDE